MSDLNQIKEVEVGECVSGKLHLNMIGGPFGDVGTAITMSRDLAAFIVKRFSEALSTPAPSPAGAPAQSPDAAATARLAAEEIRFNPLVHENATLVDQKLFIERMAKVMGLDLRDWRSADSATRGLLFERDALKGEVERAKAWNNETQKLFDEYLSPGSSRPPHSDMRALINDLRTALAASNRERDDALAKQAAFEEGIEIAREQRDEAIRQIAVLNRAIEISEPEAERRIALLQTAAQTLTRIRANRTTV